MLTIPFLPTPSLGALSLSLSLYLQPSLASTSPCTHHAPFPNLLAWSSLSLSLLPQSLAFTPPLAHHFPSPHLHTWSYLSLRYFQQPLASTSPCAHHAPSSHLLTCSSLSLSATYNNLRHLHLLVRHLSLRLHKERPLVEELHQLHVVWPAEHVRHGGRLSQHPHHLKLGVFALLGRLDGSVQQKLFETGSVVHEPLPPGK